MDSLSIKFKALIGLSLLTAGLEVSAPSIRVAQDFLREATLVFCNLGLCRIADNP